MLVGCKRNTPSEKQQPTRASASAASSTALPDDDTETVDDEPDKPGGDVETVDDEPERHQSACAPPDPKLKPMLLLKFKFAAAIKNREPVGQLPIVRPGGRVYAHMTVRNRSGRKRCLHLEFRVNGKKRTKVTLRVGRSWSWRTWAYNTTRSSDRGPLELIVHDDQGKLFLRRRLAIVPMAK